MHDESLTLLELNNIVREVLELNLESTYKVKAELSEVRVNAKGHCFVELIQRDERNNTPVAKARGIIMSHLYPLIKMDFEETTGQEFCAGLQVLLAVSPQFNETYGYSLIITDIDPTFTLGDMVRRRKEILDRLEKEGVKDLNASLQLPLLLQNIAVISSATAAGFGDFCHQLENNIYGFHFNYRLFPAVMQGEETEHSIIEALNQIANDSSCKWDAVVIIRGGGAVSDLNGFETYNLANNCAQFPIPIITGIGHERDTTILDFVANVHLKTPTAVATFLIEHMSQNAEYINSLYDGIMRTCNLHLQTKQNRLNCLSSEIQYIAANFKSRREIMLNSMYQQLCQIAIHHIEMDKVQIDKQEAQFKLLYENRKNSEINRLKILEQSIKMNDPERILSRGYSITRINGHAINDASELKSGDIMLTLFANGEVKSIVK